MEIRIRIVTRVGIVIRIKIRIDNRIGTGVSIRIGTRIKKKRES